MTNRVFGAQGVYVLGVVLALSACSPDAQRSSDVASVGSDQVAQVMSSLVAETAQAATPEALDLANLPFETKRSAGGGATLEGAVGSIDLKHPARSGEQLLVRLRASLGGDGREGFAVRRVEANGDGQVHLHADQTIGGVPVAGARMLVHADATTGEVGLTHGRFVSAKGLPSEARLSAAEAGAVIGVDPAELTRTYVLDRSGTPHLAWAGIVGGASDRARLFVDALTGKVVAKHGVAHTLAPVVLHDRQHSLDTSSPGRIRGNDRIPANATVTERDCVTFARQVRQYFADRHGRDGVREQVRIQGPVQPGHGPPSLPALPWRVAVNYGRNTGRAFWTSESDAVFFGNGDAVIANPARDPDVVAHELTHGVIAYSAGLIYIDESGALNEAFADIFAASIDAYRNGRLRAESWRIAETAFTPSRRNDALRYMHDPAADGASADHYSQRGVGEPFVEPGDQDDNGFVHTNSGIANLAYALLVNGGRHPRRDGGPRVTAIGIAKAERIFYRALTTYMHPLSGFGEARWATIRAAEDLYPDGAEAASVASAWSAVGVAPLFDGRIRPMASLVASSGATPSFGQSLTINAGIHFRPLRSGYLRELGGRWRGTKTIRLYERATQRLLRTAVVSSSEAWSYTEVPGLILSSAKEYTVMVTLRGNATEVSLPLAMRKAQEVNGIQILGPTVSAIGRVPTQVDWRRVRGLVDIGFEPFGIRDHVAVGRYHSVVVKNGVPFAYGRSAYDYRLGGGGRYGASDTPVVTRMLYRANSPLQRVTVGSDATLGVSRTGLTLWHATRTTPVQSGREGVVTARVGSGDHLVLQYPTYVSRSFRGVESTLAVPSSAFPIISAGRNHVALSRRRSRTVRVWGGNELGQLTPNTGFRGSWLSVTLPRGSVEDVVAGADFTLILSSDRTVWAFGSNRGQVVDPNRTIDVSSSIRQVPGLRGIRKIAAGDQHALALGWDGNVYAWGRASEGQIGTNAHRRVRVLLATNNRRRVVSIGAGGFSSMVLRRTGGVAWGEQGASYGRTFTLPPQ